MPDYVDITIWAINTGVYFPVNNFLHMVVINPGLTKFRSSRARHGGPVGLAGAAAVSVPSDLVPIYPGLVTQKRIFFPLLQKIL